MPSVTYTITGGSGARSSGGPANGEVLTGSYTINTPGSFTAVVGAGGTPAGYSSQATAYFAAMTVQPDTTRKGLIDTLITGLIADGVWSKLDYLMLLAAHDAQAARLNAVNVATVASAVNSPAFTVDRGYAGDGAGAHLDLNITFVSAPQYTQNSAHVGVWVNASPGESGSPFGHGGNATASRCFLAVPLTGNETYRINDSTSDVLKVSAGNGLGWRLISRTGASIKRGYRDAPRVSDLTTPSVSLPAGNVTVLRRQSSYSPDRVAAFCFGAGLNDTENTAIYSRISTFLTALGAT